MPFPQIRHCLICEDARPEPSGKSTLLGFFGVAPDVKIALRDFEIPMPRLAFVLVGDEASDGGRTFAVGAKISDEQDGSVFEFPATKTTLPADSATKKLNMGVTMSGVRFARPGKYYFTFLVDGSRHFRASFDILQGNGSLTAARSSSAR